MMKQIVLGAVAAAALCGTALAADVYEPVHEPVYTPHVEKKKHHGIGSGWYLRGDVGYAFNDLKGASYWLPGGIENDFDSAEVDDSWVIGGGVGYKVNHYLRTDLTVDYMFKSDFKGSTSGFCGGGGGGVACVSEDISDFKALSLLANAYIDLGSYYHKKITPYVGAGIGGTHISWSDLKNTSCPPGGGVCDPTITHEGEKEWRFTYALMAGASFKINCNLALDAGYRYRHVEGGKFFGFAANGGPGSDDGFDIHEVRSGLRYTFGDCAPKEHAYVPYEPAPIYK
jgi:opacity protein-like surface antigen